MALRPDEYKHYIASKTRNLALNSLFRAELERSPMLMAMWKHEQAQAAKLLHGWDWHEYLAR